MKLSLDALKERAEATASNDLLTAISGGLDNACHDSGSGQGIADYIHGAQTLSDTQIVRDFIRIMTGN